MNRPGVLAVRAINQYRRRDVIAYLGLRYYLQNRAAQQDIWAESVATHIELCRTDAGHLQAKHFKEVNDRGEVIHRDLFIPRPNEALAEAALIGACATAGGHFRPSNDVYSYAFAAAGDRSGVFGNYMQGLQRRQDAITNACVATPDANVYFRDIKRFYPSIGIGLARRTWELACKSSDLESRYVALGHALLDRQEAEASGGLLIGPIFSHLIGNLVMRRVDEQMEGCQVPYFRYVDDITLVGKGKEAAEAFKRLESVIGELDLNLHPADSSKSLDVTNRQWMGAKDDYKASPKHQSWMTLVGDIKNLLLWHPDRRAELSRILEDEGFRIPLKNYEEAVREAGYAGSALQRMRWRWYRRKTRFITPATVMQQARTLRGRYQVEIQELVTPLKIADQFQAKRLIPMLRYRMGRLAYLGNANQLLAAADLVQEFPGLRLHAEVARAVATRNVDRLLPLGTNAAQAAAQPLRTVTSQVSLSYVPRSEAEIQSLAVLGFNGIIATNDGPNCPTSELYELAVEGVSRELMVSHSPFIAEISCLHGLGEAKHVSFLDTAFDVDEAFALDAVDQARTSLSL